MTREPLPKISVLVSCESEGPRIKDLFEDLLRQTYPQDLLEIILTGTEGIPELDAVFNFYSSEYQNVEFVRTPRHNIPLGLNLGIQQSSGDIIAIFDSNFRCFPDLLEKIALKFSDPDIDCIFGNAELKVADNSIRQLAMKACLSDRFATCDSYLRSVKSINKHFGYPFGCYHRKCFEIAGYFDTELHEEYYVDFYERLVAENLSIEVCNDLTAWRYIHTSLSKLSYNVLKISNYRALRVKKSRKSSSFGHMFAPLLVLGLITSWIAGLFNPVFLAIFFGIILIYSTLALVRTMPYVITLKKRRLLFIMPYVYFTIHSSAGWGYCIGIIRYWIGLNFLWKNFG